MYFLSTIKCLLKENNNEIIDFYFLLTFNCIFLKKMLTGNESSVKNIIKEKEKHLWALILFLLFNVPTLFLLLLILTGIPLLL